MSFLKMRDLVTRFTFRARKSLDDFLFWMLPSTWVPLYNAVSFSTAPYKQCQEHRQWQDKVGFVCFFKLFVFTMGCVSLQTLNQILIAIIFLVVVAFLISLQSGIKAVASSWRQSWDYSWRCLTFDNVKINNSIFLC